MQFLCGSLKAAADFELDCDLLSRWLDLHQRTRIVEQCVDKGLRAAGQYAAQKDIHAIIKRHGLTLERSGLCIDQEGYRLYSEYNHNRKTIVLYPAVIESAYCALPFSSTGRFRSLEDCYTFFLAHEFFHFLECEGWGVTFRQYRIPTRKILWVQTYGYIRAASEIAAHAFAFSFMDAAGN